MSLSLSTATSSAAPTQTPSETPTQPPSQTTTPTTTTGPPGAAGVSAGAIAGGVIGGLIGAVLITLIIIIIAYLVWKAKNSLSKCNHCYHCSTCSVHVCTRTLQKSNSIPLHISTALPRLKRCNAKLLLGVGPIHRHLQSCVGTQARLGYAAFDAQLRKHIALHCTLYMVICMCVSTLMLV